MGYQDSGNRSCAFHSGNCIAQSVPGVPDMQLNPCYFIQRFHKLRHYNFLVLSLFTKSTGNIAF